MLCENSTAQLEEDPQGKLDLPATNKQTA